ncbi:hypothetical protein [Haliangium ochraceum]|uniref:PilZ domain-containing protein n=1 Tax=Haliangium ochraceum (strain DSM 14365 / JCM 11303 / SMP-2) TaxID=502025 RepID=D0LGD4_HALO1|nr:hypothetical protein [Haliangium ochraceum]ACY18159.1 hypothetical protein Hoch_5682 [Haliangium ochraceum DSM 14365]
MSLAEITLDLPTTRPILKQIPVHLRMTVLPAPTLSPVEGELVSINPEHMFVRAPISPLPKTVAHLRFRMLKKRMCEARGQVVWHRNDGFGIAIEECNQPLESVLLELSDLSPNLRQLYLADVLYPRIDLSL